MWWPCPHSPVSIPSPTPDWDPLRSPRSHLVGWLPVAGACLNLHRPGLGEVAGGRGILQHCGCRSSPGAQLWHLSRSDSDSGTSQLGPMALLASLFLCSGAVAGSDTSLPPPQPPASGLLPPSGLPPPCLCREGLWSGGFCFPVIFTIRPGRRVDGWPELLGFEHRQGRCLPHGWDRLVEPWIGVSEGQTEPGRSPASPQPQCTCGQLPVSIGAPAPGISSCLHHPQPSWASHSHPRPLRGPDITHSPYCWCLHGRDVLIVTGQKNPKTSSHHVNHYTCTYTTHCRAYRYITDVGSAHFTFTQDGHTKTSTYIGI